MNKLYLNLIITVLLGVSCQEKEINPNFLTSDTLFKSLSPSDTGVRFKNLVKESASRNIGTYDYFYNGGGVAVGDINNDGLEDVFFTGNDVSNQLYLNQGNFIFEDITEDAGLDNSAWCTGATFVDINDDGWMDLYVCVSGPDYKKRKTKNLLYVNQGNNTFIEDAENYGIADGSLSTQSAFFDMDNDGDLDLWVLNHAIRNWGNLSYEWMEEVNKMDPKTKARYCNTLYRNEGNGKFKNISTEAGINEIGFGLGIAVSDYNQDGLLDVYVANDYFIPDKLYMNQGNGKFMDQLKAKVSHSSFYSMGCDASDINNDSWPDLVVLDMTPSDHYRSKMLMAAMDVQEFNFLKDQLKFTPQYMFNSLMINNSNGILSDIGHLSGVAKTDWSWCPLVADFNNDGKKDLYVSNGIKKEVKNNDWRLEILEMKKNNALDKDSYFKHLQKANAEPISNLVYENIDGFKFDDHTDQWGISIPSFSNGAVYSDLDLDGDLDLIVNNLESSAFVFKNFSNENTDENYVQIKLTDESGTHKENGARVEVYTEGETYFAENGLAKGYQSQSTSIIHLGLGKNKGIKKIKVTWRDGQTTILENDLKANQRHTIEFTSVEKVIENTKPKPPRFFNITQTGLKKPFKHRENKFDDYAKEILLPHSQSRMGPALAVGDINNDGKEDFYIGGAKGQESMLYLQVGYGFFDVFRSGDFFASIDCEEVGALFFDYNNDGLKDLYVACGGGGDFEGEEYLLQDKLYKNLGKGRFQAEKLPEMPTSTKEIQSFDWDNDGDLDLFIGGRTKPGAYPLSPNSYFLENKNGQFIDVSEEIAGTWMEMGMVTDSEVLDWDGDGVLDLVIAGEWMPITVLSYKNGQFDKIETPTLEGTEGWWYSITSGDIDNDGDSDLIVGNLGSNNKFHPSEEKPLYCYANDFDNNSTLDIVLSKEYKEKLVPVRGRECSSTQMPYLAEKFPTYDGFASADLQSIFGEENLSESYFLRANTFESIQIINEGDGSWIKQKLPNVYQTSPINATVFYDFDRNGKMDFVTAGNMVTTEVETTPYDAGKGLLSLGQKEGGHYSSYNLEETGLFLFGDVKDVQLIRMGQDLAPALLVAKNNGQLSLFLWNE